MSTNYKAGEIMAYSTDVNRTIESTSSQIFGLYGLGQGPKLLRVDKKYHLPPYSQSKDS